MSIAQTILEYILGGIMETSARSHNIITPKSFNAGFFMQPHLRIHNHAIEFLPNQVIFARPYFDQIPSQ